MERLIIGRDEVVVSRQAGLAAASAFHFGD
jgi:hypothetical protein